MSLNCSQDKPLRQQVLLEELVALSWVVTARVTFWRMRTSYALLSRPIAEMLTCGQAIFFCSWNNQATREEAALDVS